MKPRFALLFLLLSFCVRADVITDWNATFLNAIRNESTTPPLAARNLAMLHAAIYDSVNAIARTHRFYFVNAIPTLPCSSEAAALSAAYEISINLYPSQKAAFDDAYTNAAANIVDGTAKENGLVLGHAVADQVLSWRSSDGSATTVPYIPHDEPGQWRRTPPFFRPPELPQWPYVTPFAMTNDTQFRPQGPPSLTGPRYASDFNQIKNYGGASSTNRTAYQTETARFWSDFSFTVTPPGHWNQIAQNIAWRQTNSFAENARLFALLNIAMADGGIIAWDAKYAYNFWRPVTAVQQADLDNNAATVKDANWTPLLITPSFPEYPSGHSTFSAAAACVLSNFYRTDHVSFMAGSDALPGVYRFYDDLEAAAEEIGMSRIYGGIHFFAADADGLSAGKTLGNYVFQNFLRPLPAPGTLTNVRRVQNGVEILATGVSGGDYVIQVSDNLRDWTAVLTNSVPFVCRIEDEVGHGRFFRSVFKN